MSAKRSEYTVVSIDELAKELSRRGLVSVGGRDDASDLSSFIRAIDEYKLRRLKSMELEKMLLDLEAEIAKRRQELDALRMKSIQYEGNAVDDDHGQLARQGQGGSGDDELKELVLLMKNMPPDRMDEFFEQYLLYKAVTRARDPLLAYMMLSNMKRNRDEDRDRGDRRRDRDYMEMMALMQQQQEMNRQNRSSEDESNSVLLKMFQHLLELNNTLITTLIKSRVEDKPEQKSMVDQLREAIVLVNEIINMTRKGDIVEEDKLKRLEEKLNALAEEKGISADVRREIEQLRNKFNLEIEKLKMQTELEKKKMELEKEREKMKTEAFVKLAESLSRIADELVKRRDALKRVNPNVVSSEESELVKITCPECGYTFTAPANTIHTRCPNCGVQLIREDIASILQPEQNKTIESSREEQAGSGEASSVEGSEGGSGEGDNK